ARPPPHAAHLHHRLRRHTPPRRARIRALPTREEGLGRAEGTRPRRAIARGFARPRIAHSSARRALFASPCARGGPRIGWDPRVGTLFAVTSGYFLWDSVVTLVHYEGMGFVVHGRWYSTYPPFALLGIRPFLAYYGPRFLLWELSTPFLNIHWMLDKTGQTGSPLQLVNGLILFSTFAAARLVYGTMISYQFCQTLFEVRDGLSSAIFAAYVCGNLILNGLNMFWFTKMIAALRKRFDAKDTKPRSASHPTNVGDRHGAARFDSDRRLTTRGDTRRQ
ncbi:TLC domain-containing protein, partial [Russula brevipes]